MKRNQKRRSAANAPAKTLAPNPWMSTDCPHCNKRIPKRLLKKMAGITPEGCDAAVEELLKTLQAILTRAACLRAHARPNSGQQLRVPLGLN